MAARTAQTPRAARTRPAPARRPDELGEVRFDDWFSTPIFESEPDERLEELATSGRGPFRLGASAVLAVQARAAQMRPGRRVPREEARGEEVPEPAMRETAAMPSRPAPPAGPPLGLRDRVGRALDRWAEREAATQLRLERLVLPKRWQT